MTPPLYLETSALLRIFFDQQRSRELSTKIKQAERIISSRITKLEAERAVIRICIDNPEFEKKRANIERDLRHLFARTDFIEMDATVCDLAGQICPASRLRTLDAIHLATFRLLRQHVANLGMLSCDERILREISDT